MSAVLGIAVTPAESAADVVDGADVILCATNSNVPVFDGNWLVPGQHVTLIVSSNIGLKKRGHVIEMRREIDERTLERADILPTNVWGQEELDKTAVFWKPLSIAETSRARFVDSGELIRGEKSGRTDAAQITYFKNCAFWVLARRPSAD